MKTVYQMSKEELFHEGKFSEDGLLEKEAKEIREKVGENVLQETKTVQKMKYLQTVGKKQALLKIIFIFMAKMITGGLQEKKDHVDLTQKCFMIQENQHVLKIANHHVIVVNM